MKNQRVGKLHRCRPAGAKNGDVIVFYKHVAPLGLKSRGHLGTIDISPRWGYSQKESGFGDPSYKGYWLSVGFREQDGRLGKTGAVRKPHLPI